ALDPWPPALRWVPALAHGLQADLRPAHGVLLDLVDLHRQLVPDVDGLLHAAQALSSPELRDVDHTVASRREVDECAERGGLDHRAVVTLTDVDGPRVGDLLDHVDGLLRALALAGTDEHAAIVL